MQIIEFCSNLDECQFSWAWVEVKETDIDKFIESVNCVKCLKRNATALILIGEKDKNGYFISKKSKRVWLKKIN